MNETAAQAIDRLGSLPDEGDWSPGWQRVGGPEKAGDWTFATYRHADCEELRGMLGVVGVKRVGEQGYIQTCAIAEALLSDHPQALIDTLEDGLARTLAGEP